MVSKHDGYVYIYMNGKYTREHRYVWEQAYGKIPEGYVIHHKDGNRQNNRLDNLECLTRSEHLKLHHKEDAAKYSRTAKAIVVTNLTSMEEVVYTSIVEAAKQIFREECRPEKEANIRDVLKGRSKTFKAKAIKYSAKYT